MHMANASVMCSLTVKGINMEPYYYTKMSKPKQAVYHAIYQGLMALSDSFQVPKLEGRELSDVFFQLRLDHPEIFWAEGFNYRYYQD